MSILKKLLFPCLFLLTSISVFSQKQVQWKSIKNIAVENDQLIKDKSVKKWWNAGAGSTEKLSLGADGWVQAKIVKPKGARILGLSSQNTDHQWNTVEYGFYVLQSAGIQILEKGKVVHTSKLRINKGDIIKVERKDNQIHYKKNDEIVYSSKTQSGNVMFADIAMYSPGTILTEIRVSDSFQEKNTIVLKEGALLFQEDSEKNEIRINGINLTTLNAINEITGKESKTIIFEKDLKQEEFDALCKRLTWIKNLSFEQLDDVRDFNALSNLKALEIMNFYELDLIRRGVPEIDMNVFKDAKNLTELSAVWVGFSNFNILGKLQNLEKLSLINVNFTELSFLESLKKLKKLTLIPIDTRALSDYTPIAKLGELEELNIASTQFGNVTDKNLESLKQLKSLKKVNISSTHTLSSLNFLEGSKQIEEINASYCNALKDISVLKNFKDLKTLDLKYSAVKDLSPLYNCKKLTKLSIELSAESVLTQKEVDQLKAKLPKLKITITKD